MGVCVTFPLLFIKKYAKDFIPRFQQQFLKEAIYYT